jgi:hypothetical protein
LYCARRQFARASAGVSLVSSPILSRKQFVTIRVYRYLYNQIKCISLALKKRSLTVHPSMSENYIRYKQPRRRGIRTDDFLAIADDEEHLVYGETFLQKSNSLNI